MTILFILIVYLVGCVLSYATTFAWQQREFKSIAKEVYYEHRRIAMIMAVFSWASMYVLFLRFGFWGFKFK